MNEIITGINIEKLNEIIKVLTPENFLHDWNSWMALISTALAGATLVFLIIYVIKTKELATQARDANLRPVILRSGFIAKWDDIGSVVREGKIDMNPLQFKILKNIATSISGYLVKNNQKYKLLWGNDISRLDTEKIQVNESWGWMKNNSVIYAVFDGTKGEHTSESNKIVILYKDIEDNSYYTIEDEIFDQKSKKGSL